MWERDEISGFNFISKANGCPMPPAAPSIATLRSGLDSVDEYDRPTRCLDVHGLNAAREDLNTAAFILQKGMEQEESGRRED
jgi:hypothetical protein